MADHALATVTNPSSALTDFTLIVDLSDMPANWWSAVDTSDGTRGRVYKGDGSTRLACDWIDFDDTAETGLLRVLWSGTLATSGTQQLWIEPPLAANATVAASDTYGSDNAYDSSWEFYWHGNDLVDRTSNDRASTANGSVTVGGATGKIGAATDFDGSDDYISTPYEPAASTDYTWLVWANADSVRQQWIVSADTINYFGWGFGCFNTDGEFRAYSYDAGAGWIGNTGDATAVWQHWAVRYDASSGIDSVLRNGSALSASSDDSGDPITGATEIRIGGLPETYWARFDGLLNEVQVHSTQRSADWISHEYDQTADNATFWGTWSWETSGGGTTYEVSVSDALTLSDSTGASLTMPASVSDAISLSDTQGAGLIMHVSATEGLTFGDSLSGPLTMAVSAVESLKLSDAISAGFTFRVALSDTVTFDDTSTTGGLISVSVTDSIKFSDSASAVLNILANVSDTVSFSDALTSKQTFTVELTDGVTFSEAITTAMTIVATVEDTVSLSDVAADTTFLPDGEIIVTVSAKQTTVTLSAKATGVTVTSKQTSVTVS